METYTETMETTGRVLFLKVSEKGETYKEMDGVFEIITSDLVLLLLKTILVPLALLSQRGGTPLMPSQKLTVLATYAYPVFEKSPLRWLG